MKTSVPFLLLLTLLVSGCIFTGTPVTSHGGLLMTLQPDPPTVFAGDIAEIHVDLDNRNVRNIEDVNYEVFDTGLFEKIESLFGENCKGSIEFMLPGDFFSFSCPLALRQDIIGRETSTVVTARASYKTNLPAAQVVKMISEDEYKRRVATNDFVEEPAEYSYSDSNMQIKVKFSEPLPIIARPGKEYFMDIAISNVGSGFVDKIKTADFTIDPVNPDSPEILECPSITPDWSIDVVGRDFPPITCRLSVPGDVTVLENYGLLINVFYTYEMRESATVSIVR